MYTNVWLLDHLKGNEEALVISRAYHMALCIPMKELPHLNNNKESGNIYIVAEAANP
jgi:hypothetical protein